MKFKYVIYEERGNLVPVLFSALIQHDRFSYLNPVSAGFVKIDKEKDSEKIVFRCYGESVSLCLKSEESDSLLIQKHYEFSLGF